MEGCKPFRYADDMVLSFQYLRDAQRVRKVLDRRLEKYGLQLNVDKTRIVPFSKKKHKLGERQGSFKFLGFTFYLGKSIRGAIIPKLKTEGKRFRMKLQGVKSWCRTQRHQIRMVHFWKQLCAKLRGHIAYYGVSHNTRYVRTFVNEVKKIAFKWLNRRSQKRSFNWESFVLFLKHYPLPLVRVYHRLL
ncbi:reverse transcriptase domain-containing protein [Cardinium endosymbiont of Culicoides punctatus]|uniref:reverse transcriptase domain-containing protein n=1 Tax=Cardinium endosymbiont of Culicoides punctatus TaxID=2304601 RepID=UPI001058529F|nr:hypothetical protein CCPUN_07810 [Cardinium endosymbiont of Culicoides punctatus]